MARLLLWRQLRAAVREGKTEEVDGLAKALGFLDRGVRKRLLETIWKQQTRRQR